MLALAEALQAGDFAGALEQPMVMLQEFDGGSMAMLTEGKRNWKFGSLNGGEMTKTLFSQIAGVSFARMTPQDAKRLHSRLVGPAGHQLLQGMMAAPDRTYQLSMLVILIDAIGVSAGMSQEGAEAVTTELEDREMPTKDLPPVLCKPR